MPVQTTAWLWPPRTPKGTRNAITGLLWELHDGGDIEDPSGRALTVLRDRLSQRPITYRLPETTASYLFKTIEEGRYGRCIERDVGGGRVYSIRLLLGEDELPRPRPWPPPVDVPEPDDEPEEEEWPDDEPADPEPVEPEPVEPPAFALPPASTAIEKLLVVQRVATDVILDLAEMAGREAARSDDGAATRLAEALEESTRLRRKLAEATETLRAKSAELEAVRKALRQVQANLDALRTGSQVNDSGFKALNRMMRELPQNGRQG